MHLIFKPCPHHEQCEHQTWFRQEEIASAYTHFIAFLLGIIAFVFLLNRALASQSTLVLLAACIYGGATILTFLASALYHFTIDQRAKQFFHILDHMAIFLMIAGSYTPFTLITLHGPWGWSLFSAVWGIALFGMLFKSVFTGRLNLLSTFLYLLMGWLVIIAIVPLIAKLPHAGFLWLLSGGVLYTIGAFFYMMERLPFAHVIWHLFVIGGWATQFVCIYDYVMPMHT